MAARLATAVPDGISAFGSVKALDIDKATSGKFLFLSVALKWVF